MAHSLPQSVESDFGFKVLVNGANPTVECAFSAFHFKCIMITLRANKNPLASLLCMDLMAIVKRRGRRATECFGSEIYYLLSSLTFVSLATDMMHEPMGPAI